MLILIALVSTVVFALVVALSWLAMPAPPLDQWPPISDDEFLRRCSPGVDRERALKVRRIVARQLGVDYERVYPEQRFVEDLGA